MSFNLLILTVISYLFSTSLFADSPPVTDITKMKGGSANGVITATSGVIGSVSPGVTGNVLTSNGTIWTSAPSMSGGTITALTGDVSASGSGSVAATVNTVGGVSAANVASGANLANGATASSTSNSIVRRDASANFTAGNITSNTIGDHTGTIDTVATSTVVAGAAAANAASTSVTSNTIAKRDGFANLYASTFIGNLQGDVTGNASNVTGVVAIANGGTGQSNQQAGLNNITDITSHSNGDVLQLLSGNAQFAPLAVPGLTGSANTPAYYDGSGNLASAPWYSYDPTSTALSYNYNGPALTSGAQALQTGLNADVSGGAKFMHNMYSSGAAEDYFGFNLNSNDVVSGNSSLVNIGNSNTIGGNLVILNSYNNGATIGGDFRMLQIGNSAQVNGNAAGVLANQQGVVKGSYTGTGNYLLDDSGTAGNNNNVVYFDGSDQGAVGKVIHGNLFGLNINNNHSVPDTNSSFQAISVNNSGSGYRFTGLGIYNQPTGDMTEEIRGGNINLQGDARTATLWGMYLTGAYTDDVHGLQVDISNATSASTTAHPMMGELAGGNFAVYGKFIPFNNANVDIGNYYSTTTEIANGSPVVGTDVIQQVIQSNLLLHDTISPGPFGLGVNSVGIVPQIALDSGVVLPYHRTALLGTSVPQGSGGTVTDGVVADLIGYISFGGSVGVDNLVGLQDAQLFGQQFCDYATDCWFMRVRDTRAETGIPKLAINTQFYKVSNPEVGLEINDKHIKSTQTTPPTTTVNANAGTGASCVVVNATDTAGIIEITFGSGSFNPGVQCAVTFDSAYSVAPICTVTANNAQSALDADTHQIYFDTTTTDLNVNFGVQQNNAGAVSRWMYHCMETN